MTLEDDPTRTRRVEMDGARPRADAPEATLPESIGAYRILSILGEGGMGIVYEAEQQSPRRRVALKVVRGGPFVSEQRVRLLQREAETLARLDHPGIGAIYESGRTESGQHFFAMELVRGRTLGAYIASRGPATEPAELRHRLNLFRRIAEAVHYAHQRGVIHRDLKPSNLIVTERDPALSTGSSGASPTHDVKILDFGLARITETDVALATMATEVGAIKGTLQYMSPEQARGSSDAIDLRADVYALGTILFEMLSGERPYDVSGRSLVDAVHVICNDPPRSLSAVWSGSRRIDADLETIVGMAMEKQADRRYSSAAALATDIERYLTSQPILARPPSTFYQLRKFAARHRALVGGITSIFVVLVAAVIVSANFGLREAAQRREADRARNDLQALVDFQSGMLSAIPAEEMGSAMLDDLRGRVVERAGEEAGLSFDGLMAQINATDAALEVIDRQILVRASQRIDEQFGEQPAIAGELRATLAQTYFALGQREQALAQSRQAYALFRAALGPEDPRTLEEGRLLADRLRRQGETEEGRALLESVLAAQTRVLGANDPATLRSRYFRAVFAWQQQRYDDALADCEAALAAYRDQGLEASRDARNVMTLMALIYGEVGRADESVAILEPAIEISTTLDGADDPDTLLLRHNYALALSDLGRHEEAMGQYGDVLERRRRVLGVDHPRTLRTWRMLALELAQLQRFEDAARIARQVLDGYREAGGADHPDAIFVLEDLAGLTTDLGRLEEADAMYRELADRSGRVFGETDPLTLGIQAARADLLRMRYELDEAEAVLLEALEEQRRQIGPSARATLRSRAILAAIYEETGREEQAATLRAEISSALFESSGEADPGAVSSLGPLARLLARLGRIDEAQARATRMLELADAAFGDEHRLALEARSVKALVLGKQQRWDEAETLLLQVKDTWIARLGRDHRRTADALHDLACLYRDQGRYEEARAMFEEVDEIHRRLWGPDHPFGVENLEEYAKLLRTTGDESEAPAIEARVTRWSSRK